MNAACRDTVKSLLEAGKSTIFRSQSLCTYIYVHESQRFWDSIHIYYMSRNGFGIPYVYIRTEWLNCSCGSY